MPVDLYCMDPSPPNRAVYLCIQALGLNVNKKPINLFTKEQLDPEFVKVRDMRYILSILKTLRKTVKKNKNDVSWLMRVMCHMAVLSLLSLFL